MARITARQFAEWMAFDQVYGLGDMYEKELFAQLHELIQINNQLTGASLQKKGGKNPAGKFRNAPRPWVPEDPNLEDPDDEDDDEDDEYRIAERESQARQMAQFDAAVFGPDAKDQPVARI